MGLTVAATAVLTSRRWWWQASVVASSIALVGVLLGVAAVSAGAGPSTRLNDAYHATMVVALTATLVAVVRLRNDGSPARARRLRLRP
ncbi:MAG TPA: hypothetical protein VHF25_03655 [Nitriliruptorales bacterium]|nr:hypothetical protein [Nitriliruptorales bacterium]